MIIEVTHALGVDEARRRVDAAVDGLLTRELPAGTSLKNVTRAWTGNRLDFSLVAGRGFFDVPISGHLLAADASATLDVKLPDLMVMFMGEDRIRTAVEAEFQKIFLP